MPALSEKRLSSPAPRAALGAPAHWRSPRPAPKCSSTTEVGAKEAEAVVAQIRKAGGRADAIAADLAAPDGPHRLAKQVRAIVGDRLDIVVANAGISKAATIEETTVEDFDKLFAVNVRAPFLVVQQLIPILSKGSSIVFVSSLAAQAVVGTIPLTRRQKTPSTRW